MRPIAALILSLLIFVALPPVHAAAPMALALPFIAQSAPFAAAPVLPDSATLALPFTVLDSVPPEPAYHNGLWYLVAYRVDSGDLNGGWLLTWDGVGTPAQARQISYEAASEPRSLPQPDRKLGPSRFSLTETAAGVWAWSYPASTGRGHSLRVERVSQ